MNGEREEGGFEGIYINVDVGVFMFVCNGTMAYVLENGLTRTWA